MTWSAEQVEGEGGGARRRPRAKGESALKGYCGDAARTWGHARICASASDTEGAV